MWGLEVKIKLVEIDHVRKEKNNMKFEVESLAGNSMKIKFETAEAAKEAYDYFKQYNNQPPLVDKSIKELIYAKNRGVCGDLLSVPRLISYPFRQMNNWAEVTEIVAKTIKQ